MIDQDNGMYFLSGKYLNMFINEEDNPEELTEEELNKIESLIPEGKGKIKFIQYVRNQSLQKILCVT
jgi:hypothetical protein